MPDSVRIEREGELATLWLERDHGNAINPALAADLIRACTELDGDDRIRGVMLAGSGRLFCPGLDLQELIELERAGIEDFLDRFTRCILTLYTLRKPLVARIHGHAVAGGCVLTLTADWRVLREGALVGLNEVRVGVPFPFGVSMILRESVPSAKVEEVALFGRNYRGHEAVRAGLAHETHGDGEFDARCRERLEELSRKNAKAFAITKRYLRSPVVERIRAHEAESLREFVDAWFLPETQAGIRTIVQELRNRSR